MFDRAYRRSRRTRRVQVAEPWETSVSRLQETQKPGRSVSRGSGPRDDHRPQFLSLHAPISPLITV